MSLLETIPSPASVPWAALYLLLLVPIPLVLATAIYNLYLHPLRAYPGPLLSRALPLPHALRMVSGAGALRVHALHERYGPVVRIGPNHLSYTDVRAWKDIFGHRTGPAHVGLQENPKARLFYRDPLLDDESVKANISLINAGREEHGRLRRAVAAGFSERAMREQEQVIRGYVDLLVRALMKRAESGEKVDVVRWYNWTTFDVIGDLVWAEPFGCLEREASHPFVDTVTGLVKQAAAFVALRYVGVMSVGVIRAAVARLVRALAYHASLRLRTIMDGKVRRRLEVQEERYDLFEGLVQKREELNLTLERLKSNAVLLAAAGSDTTANLLSGVTFLLLQNPEAMDKLKREVRSSFGSIADITIVSVSRLPWMLACLNEALRRFPPAISNLPREVHEGGEVIAGQVVPGGTIVEVQYFAMNHSTQHWHDPFAYRPERWLNKVESKGGEAEERGEKDADGDRLEAMQSFSVGPRNCVGRNLAYAEMRLILARIIYEFDLTLADESKDWLKRCMAYTTWVKPPLYVYLKAAQRS